MEQPTIEELNDIKSHVSEVDGKIYPNMKSVRILFDYFSKYVHPMDLKCAKCISHVILYWKKQTERHGID